MSKDWCSLGRLPLSSVCPRPPVSAQIPGFVPASREADVLTFLFPLSLLFEGAYVVGLEAVIFGPGDPTDFVQEGPREDLMVSSRPPLPFDPAILLGAGVGLAILSVVGLKRVLTKNQL